MAHGSAAKKRQKAFKSRHASKSSIKAANKGRIDKPDGANGKKHVMSKLERRNVKSQLRNVKQSALLEKSKIFDGRNGVPRNVVIVPLTPDINSINVSERVSSVLGGVSHGMGVVSIPKFRQKFRFFVPQFQEFFEILDAARAADFVVFVLSASTEITDYGEQIVRCIAAQGVTTSLGAIWDLPAGAKHQNLKEKDIRESLTSWFSHFFPEERLYALDIDNEVTIAGRIMCQKSPKGLHWRDERAYIIPEQVEQSPNGLALTGSIRGQPLALDSIMHIHGVGDLRVARIETLTEANEVNKLETEDLSNEIDVLVAEADAIELNDDGDDEHLEGQGIRVDGQDDVTAMIEAGITDNGPRRAANVPEGTSEYQAAWFVEGEDYRSDPEDDADTILTDEEGDLVEGAAETAHEDMDASSDESEGDDMEMDYDEEDYDEDEDAGDIQKKAKEDLEFPDEVELDPMVPGKTRLRRYRGVRSIRHTDWDAYEADARAPVEFTRLYRPGNIVAAKNRASKFRLEAPHVAVGSKARVFLIGVDVSAQSVADLAAVLNRGATVVAYGLLAGEEKLGYMTSSITMDSEVTEPTKSKEEIVVQYGPRRLLINPLFNQGGHSDNHVYKFNRFLHPGRAAAATYIAPVFLSNAPVVYYNTTAINERRILGTGTVIDSDANRIIVKTAILTGLPVKIHRKLITVKHMFFSRDDVEWFRSVPLFTKSGAQGVIKEPLGTHGLFKATFDKKIRSEDTIALALYKRVWAKVAKPAPF